MWLLPSRQRPLNLKRFFAHWAMTGADTPGVVWLDEGDNYDSLSVPPNWTIITSPRLGGTGEITNKFFEMFPNEPWYGLLGDDVIPHTEEWDRKLVEAAGSDGLAYGDDGIHGIRHAAHPVVAGDMVRELGWLALPGCKRIFIDDALMEFARRRGKLKYLPDVIMEHAHYTTGKSAYDETYAKPDDEKLADKAIYEAWVKSLEKPVVFVCVNHGNYLGKGVEYVNKLFDMCSRNISANHPGRFVCYSDDNGVGYHPDITVLPLPKEVTGWWAKLYLFKSGLFAQDERIIYLDLDTCITGSLDNFLNYDGEFAILQDFYQDRLAPGMMMWRSGFGTEIWEDYVSSGYPVDLPLGDLDWINNQFEAMGYKPQIIQDLFPREVVSYKVHALNGIPTGAKVVCFHGLPRPHSCEGWVPHVWKIGGGTALELTYVCNTGESEIVNNIRSALKMPYPWLKMMEPHNGHAIIVGGAPSLTECLGSVKAHQERGHVVFATNNTFNWLCDRGITPDCHVMLDARAENKDFCPKKQTLCYYSSQVHPSVFEGIKGFPAVLWHPMIDGILDVIGNNSGDALVGGGTTVGLKAIALAYILGYRNIDIYGMDSSYKGDENHAYKQPLNDSEHVLDVEMNGKKYKSAAWMCAQVEQFKEIVPALLKDGCAITVYGEGLLPDVAKLMNTEERLAA